MVAPGQSLFQYWLHCNTRLYLVRSANYGSLFGVPEIFLQIPRCKKSWLIRAAALYCDYEVYVRLNIYTHNFKTRISLNISAKLRKIQIYVHSRPLCE